MLFLIHNIERLGDTGRRVSATPWDKARPACLLQQETLSSVGCRMTDSLVWLSAGGYSSSTSSCGTCLKCRSPIHVGEAIASQVWYSAAEALQDPDRHCRAPPRLVPPTIHKHHLGKNQAQCKEKRHLLLTSHHFYRRFFCLLFPLVHQAQPHTRPEPGTSCFVKHIRRKS